MKTGTLVLAMLATACAPRAAQALGSAAPFAPPQAASSPAGEAAAAGPAAPAGGLAGIRLGTRPMALIDGEWRLLGQSARGARLTAVHARGATLVHADGRSEQLLIVPADFVITRPSAAQPSSKVNVR